MAPLIAIHYSQFECIANIRMCEESEVSKVKVPLICPSTAGVPALRDGR